MSDDNHLAPVRDESEVDILRVTRHGEDICLEGTRWRATLGRAAALQLWARLGELVSEAPEEKKAGATGCTGKGF